MTTLVKNHAEAAGSRLVFVGRRLVRAASLGVAILVGASVAAETNAQSPPWPNGCTVAFGVQGIQQGLDAIFLEACDRHDLCWGQCNGPNGPYLDLGHRLQCDVQLLAETEAACLVWSAVLAFPLDDFDSAGDFLAYCSGAAAAMFAGVSTPLGTELFWTSQCLHGCNPDACDQIGLPYPGSCGAGQCFYLLNYSPCTLNPFLWWCDTCSYAPYLHQCQDECVLNPGNCPVSPIVLDLGGDGIRLSGECEWAHRSRGCKVLELAAVAGRRSKRRGG